ncbi:GNAT family N-acetyltransferase [Aquirhabdus sp.]|uniref:GNAT family N-acetyltransferase n=1 Tax=Aquirhabdus sp. TaxID=2824160 RepID=UPI00396C3C91
MNQPSFRSLPILRSMPPFPKRVPKNTPKRGPNLECEIAEDSKTILEIQRFRAQVFGGAYNIYFDDGIDNDQYDQYSIHVLVRDTATKKIIACTRVITPKAKESLGQYYSESEFNLDEYLKDKKQVYEIGRTCVDEAYRGGKALAVLWMGMVPLILNQLKAEYLIGTVSVNLTSSHKKIIATEGYLHKKAKLKDFTSRVPFDLEHYLTKEDDFFSFAEHSQLKYHKKDVPSLFKKYRRVGASFSKEGYFDADFNCVDYFVSIKVNKRLLFKLNVVCKIIEMKKKKS